MDTIRLPRRPSSGVTNSTDALCFDCGLFRSSLFTVHSCLPFCFTRPFRKSSRASGNSNTRTTCAAMSGHWASPPWSWPRASRHFPIFIRCALSFTFPGKLIKRRDTFCAPICHFPNRMAKLSQRLPSCAKKSIKRSSLTLHRDAQRPMAFTRLETRDCHSLLLVYLCQEPFTQTFFNNRTTLRASNFLITFSHALIVVVLSSRKGILHLVCRSQWTGLPSLTISYQSECCDCVCKTLNYFISLLVAHYESLSSPRFLYRIHHSLRINERAIKTAFQSNSASFFRFPRNSLSVGGHALFFM